MFAVLYNLHDDVVNRVTADSVSNRQGVRTLKGCAFQRDYNSVK